MVRTILVADDSVTIRRVVELTFADTPLRVECVGTGAEAIERLDSISPDLVLADVVMPEPTGYEICAHVKRSRRPVPVLLLAGTFEPFDPARARSCGADGHVVKPFDSRSLVEVVEKLLAASASRTTSESDGDAEAEIEAEAVLDNLASECPTDADLPARGAHPVVDDEAPDSEEPEPAPPPADGGTRQDLSPEQFEALVRAVVERLSDRVVRDVAWDVVPDLAETLIRERLRQIEGEGS
jgi:CheY-like chemotaxis protein